MKPDRRPVFALSLHGHNPADPLGLNRHPRFIELGMRGFLDWGFEQAKGRYSRVCFKVAHQYDAHGYLAALRSCLDPIDHDDMCLWFTKARSVFDEVGVFVGFRPVPTRTPDPADPTYAAFWRDEYLPVIRSGCNALWFDQASADAVPLTRLATVSAMFGYPLKIGGEAFPVAHRYRWFGTLDLTSDIKRAPFMASLEYVRTFDPEGAWEVDPLVTEAHVLTEFHSFAGMADAEAQAELDSLRRRGFIVGAFAGTPERWLAPVTGKV